MLLWKLTRASPHLSEVAVALSGLFAELHHISAQRLRRDGNLAEVLVVVAEVHGEEHLQTQTSAEALHMFSSQMMSAGCRSITQNAELRSVHGGYYI